MQSVLYISSTSSKNYFQYAVGKNQTWIAAPSKKYCNSVRMSNILRNVLKSREDANPL